MISEFIANLGKRSHARPTLFQLEFLTVPSMMQRTAGISDFQRDLKFFCVGIDAPGTQILTQENRVYDLPQKFAYMKAHDDINLTIRVDKDHYAQKFFQAWVDSIYNNATGNVFYKSSYVGRIRLSPMMEDGVCPFSTVYEDAFPLTVGNLSYSWESTGQVMQFNVTLAFTRKKFEARSALFTNSNNNRSAGNNNLDQNLDFDVMSNDRNISTVKNSIYSTINSGYIDGNTQKNTSTIIPIDFNVLKKYKV